MKKILVPISFSEASKNALIQAYSIAKQYGATLTLLHCYPQQEHSREFDFGKEDYESGVDRMLEEFYNENLENENEHEYDVIIHSGSFSEQVSEISADFDLLLMCRKIGFQNKSKSYFNDKIFFISSLSHCPVLITSPNQQNILLKQFSNLWHIDRNKIEKDLVSHEIQKFGIDSKLVVTKSLVQEKFHSVFWKKIVTYSKTHEDEFLEDITESFENEHIDVLILVNHFKGMFEIFVKDYAFQVLQRFNVPILILQSMDE